jgi:hypothetical protein
MSQRTVDGFDAARARGRTGGLKPSGFRFRGGERG